MGCQCPNNKHFQGCSISPDGDFCIWCKSGCLKRINAVHVRV